MEPAPTTTRRGVLLLSRAELCAMGLTTLVAVLACVLVALPLDREASPGLVVVLTAATFGGILLGSELAERWEATKGRTRAVVSGYGVAIPALLAVLVLVFVL